MPTTERNEKPPYPIEDEEVRKINAPVVNSMSIKYTAYFGVPGGNSGSFKNERRSRLSTDDLRLSGTLVKIIPFRLEAVGLARMPAPQTIYTAEQPNSNFSVELLWSDPNSDETQYVVDVHSATTVGVVNRITPKPYKR